MPVGSNAGDGDVIVDAATEWKSYEALPPAIRRTLSEANAKFSSAAVLGNFRTLERRGLSVPAIETALRIMFDEAAHQAHLKAGSVAPKAQGLLTPKRW